MALAVTPLAALLVQSSAAQGEPVSLVAYNGALTPEWLSGGAIAQSVSSDAVGPALPGRPLSLLDAPIEETTALTESVAAHDLGWLRRVALRGEDRYRWLSGMVTNIVSQLPPGSGAYNLVLNAQGRIQGDLYAWRDADWLEIEVTAAQSAALLAHLDRFLIMDDVELLPVLGETAIGLTGPLAEELLARLGLPALNPVLNAAVGDERLRVADGLLRCADSPNDGFPVRLLRAYGAVVPHYELWVPNDRVEQAWRMLLDAGAKPVGARALEALRIAEGIPAYGIEIAGRDLAQETGQMRAISFTKGCYLGQEIVERVRSRGQVHRHLRHLELQGAPAAPQTELLTPEGKPAGTILSVASLPLRSGARHFALAMIRAEAETGVGGIQLPYAGGSARILVQPPRLQQEAAH